MVEMMMTTITMIMMMMMMMMTVMTEGVNKRMQSMQSNSLSKCVGITF